MLSWAQQRKFFFTSGVTLFLLVVFGSFGFYALYNAPDCANGSRDGDERGVDCGGSCPRVCAGEAELPVVHFTRALEVSEGVWGAVAYVENRNEGVGAWDVPYVLKLYDEENILLYERHGTTFIPPRKVFAVFEGRMMSGSRIPARATFSFTAQPEFFSMQEPELTLRTGGFASDERSSTLQATITNQTGAPVRGVEATALLFGSDGNVIGASATALRELPKESSATLTFTWPRPLEEPSRIEVLYVVPGR